MFQIRLPIGIGNSTRSFVFKEYWANYSSWWCFWGKWECEPSWRGQCKLLKIYVFGSDFQNSNSYNHNVCSSMICQTCMPIKTRIWGYGHASFMWLKVLSALLRKSGKESEWIPFSSILEILIWWVTLLLTFQEQRPFSS